MRLTLLANHCPLWHTPIAHCYLIEGHVHIFPFHTDRNRHWLSLGSSRQGWVDHLGNTTGIWQGLHDCHCLTGSVMFCSLRQVRLAKKLIACHIQLNPVISTHLILTPHAHLMLELKIERLQKLEFNADSFLHSQLM